MFSRKLPRPPVQKTCSHCGKELLVKPSRIEKSESGLVFCSHSCAAQYRASLLEPNAECHYCGTQFRRPPSELERSNVTYATCSRECYERARQEGIADKRRPVGRFGQHEVKCAQCGTSIYLRPSRISETKHQFCSRECKRRFQITSGKHVPREYLKSKYTCCQICGLDQTNILVIHHVDADRENNKLDNLLVVCPNCHMRIHKGLI